MNRTFIRIVGFFITITGVVFNRSAKAYPAGCIADSPEIAGGVQYQYVNCDKGVTGYIVYGDYLTSRYPECSGNSHTSFTGCSMSGGYCNGNMIFCPDNNAFFKNQGCTTTGTTGSPCYYETGTFTSPSPDSAYYFLGCATGFYAVGTGSSMVESSSGPTGLYANCAPCSGLRYNNSGIVFETYPNPGGQNNISGFHWYSSMIGAGATITSCFAGSISGQPIKDYTGEFVLTADCPYID